MDKFVLATIVSYNTIYSFFIHSHYDEVSVLLAVGITAVSMNWLILQCFIQSTLFQNSNFHLEKLYLGDGCKYSMSKGVKYEK